MPRFSDGMITTPASGSVVPRHFDAGYAFQQYPDAVWTTLEPLVIGIEVWSDGARIATSTVGPTVTLEGQIGLTIELDASVILVPTINGEAHRQSVVYVDQTRDD